MSVSIIIRTLNEERYLRELLLSIKNQDFPNEVEVVVVDSGSTDSTIEIAKIFNAGSPTLKKLILLLDDHLMLAVDFLQAKYLFLSVGIVYQLTISG